MTSQGSASGRFTRAIKQRNLFQAELALREMGTPSLLVALEYVELLADVRPDKFDRAAVRWHGRLESETPLLTLAESQLALVALAALRERQRDAADVLRKLFGRCGPRCCRVSLSGEDEPAASDRPPRRKIADLTRRKLAAQQLTSLSAM
jgi:hypothetical protein